MENKSENDIDEVIPKSVCIGNAMKILIFYSVQASK